MAANYEEVVVGLILGAWAWADESAGLAQVWETEFVPTQDREAATPAGLTRVDHLAETMDYDEMLTWLQPRMAGRASPSGRRGKTSVSAPRWAAL